MVIVANLDDWFRITKNVGKTSITSDPAFIEVISNVFNVRPFIVVVYKYEEPLLGCVLYKKGNSITHPLSNIYTSIWLNSSSDLLIQETMLFWLTELIKYFKRIEFNLPPEIADIRVFYHVGFKAYTYYTYINNLENAITIKPKIENLIKRAENQEIEFNWNDKSIDLIKQQTDSFKSLGYKKNYTHKIELVIKKLLELGMLIPVSAREKNTRDLLASSYILSDYYNKTALNLFLTSDKKNYNTGVHSAIYFRNLQFLKSEGYRFFDLCGATTLGIGNFKANFRGDLTPFYIVKFSRLRWNAILITRNFKKFMMSLKNRLNF
ncbi:MAG TPA: hypothetical protein VL125_16665 [Pelobium sp.]|nr:hypothetical protein [Pelobium sp.]